MTNVSPSQAAADALTAAVIDRQLYVLQGVAAIDPAVDHAKLNNIVKLMDDVKRAGHSVSVAQLMKDAEAAALAQSLLD